ncbi:hypothetical protein [Roseibium marinum]|uniref:Uncharacterized protein n=1 Tax=Roseibium marinum TaxID=281252 RepID=A0A2S3UTF1_9HYPH|nr:hypothetical protein [Roseibium marinum]POF30853.1 hypothetical protein CLV41_10531 [Roseibium marinum]
MTGQTEKFDDLLRLRTAVVQELSAVFAEHHRLLQVASAAEFKSLDEATCSEAEKEKEAVATKIECNAAASEKLTAELDRIDRELERNDLEGEVND